LTQLHHDEGVSGCVEHALFLFVHALKRDVVLELSLVSDVGRGVDAGEAAEIVNEMGLVEVPSG
jgi:hypothetical protein